METKYICPACNREQKQIRQWQQISIGYLFDLQSNQWTGESDRTEGGEHEAFSCPDCGEDLPDVLVEQLKMFQRM